MNMPLRNALPGSERGAPLDARVVRPADPDQKLRVSVLVRRRAQSALHSRVASLAGVDSLPGFMSRDEFARVHGADPKDFTAVRTFAAQHGLHVVEEHGARRTAILEGTVAEFSSAFGVQLHEMESARGTFRGRIGVIQLPAELGGIVEAVLGLDDRPQAKPHFRLRPPPSKLRTRAGSPRAASYTPLEVASLYGFPNGDGSGQCIALIELGGGFSSADLDAYFRGLGVVAPTVLAISVDGASNAPTGAAAGPDGEVMLDVEVAGAIAPRANIAVYFAPNTDAGFLDAITTAIHDGVNKPSVISISWGGPELSWTAQAKIAMDEAFQAAATLGITVCVASGDNGSSDGVTGGADTVDFPASSPYVLACGGTSLSVQQSSITNETVWNTGPSGGASGGGISAFFAAPPWQVGLRARNAEGISQVLTMRGVPDVSGDADPETGYEVHVHGGDTVIGGTSAVAPLWSALIARINSIKGTSVGLVNARLYENAAALRDITQGNNGDFDATPGWDACTGLGSPDGMRLRSVFVDR